MFDVVQACRDTGTLPVIDYIMSPNFINPVEDYLVTGNTLGELSTLTNRPYNCDVTVETPTELYFLPKEVILSSIQQDTDIVHG